jgi:hypothetical protein
MKLIVLKEGNYTINKNKEFTLMNNIDAFSGIKIATPLFYCHSKRLYIIGYKIAI